MEIIRKSILEVLGENEVIEPILLPYSTEELREIIFNRENKDSKKEYYVIAKELRNIIHKIDFTNISFDNVNIEKLDLSKLKGVKINPQKVYKKSLYEANLTNAQFISYEIDVESPDLFKGVDIRGTTFGNNNKIAINPHIILGKDLTKTKLRGLDFTDVSFDGVIIVGTDFTGTTGVKINPQTVKHKHLTAAILCNVDFTGFSFDNTRINHANFTGSIGARINPNKVDNGGFRVDGMLTYNSTGFNGTNCKDAILTDLPNSDIIIDGAKFNEDNLKQLKEENEYHKKMIKSLVNEKRLK